MLFAGEDPNQKHSIFISHSRWLLMITFLSIVAFFAGAANLLHIHFGRSENRTF